MNRETIVIRIRLLGFVLAVPLLVAGCGTSTFDRSLTGGALGALAGAGTGALIGPLGVGAGALIGAGAGAAAGGLTHPDQVNLGRPVYHMGQ